MIPVSFASDISVSNDNIAIDDSINGNLAVEDMSLEEGDESLAINEYSINQDKKSVSQDELLENSNSDSEYDSDDDPELDSDSEYDPDDDPELDSDSEYDPDDDPELDFDSDDGGDDWDLDDDEDDWDDNKYYTDMINGILKKNHSKRTILDTYAHFDPRLKVYALFLDKNLKPLNNTKVYLKVNGYKFSLKTDEYGFAFAIILFDRYKLKYFYVSWINPVTGEIYTFPEIYFDVHDSKNYASSTTTGVRFSNNAYFFSIDSSGIKSTIKNEKGIVSKAVTYSKGNVILSTNSNKAGSSNDSGSSEKIVIDRFSRYLIYLIAALCIAIPIGVLRYRKR